MEDLDAVSQIDLLDEPLSTRIALIEQARLTFGPEFAKRLWIAAGLPTFRRQVQTKQRSPLGAHVQRFVAECLNPDPLCEIRAEAVFASFCEWAAQNGVPPMTTTSLGRLLKGCGIASRHSNTTIYVGVRLTWQLKNPDPLTKGKENGALGSLFSRLGSEKTGGEEEITPNYE